MGNYTTDQSLLAYIKKSLAKKHTEECETLAFSFLTAQNHPIDDAFAFLFVDGYKTLSQQLENISLLEIETALWITFFNVSRAEKKDHSANPQHQPESITDDLTISSEVMKLSTNFASRYHQFSSGKDKINESGVKKVCAAFKITHTIENIRWIKDFQLAEKQAAKLCLTGKQTIIYALNFAECKKYSSDNYREGYALAKT